MWLLFLTSEVNINVSTMPMVDMKIQKMIFSSCVSCTLHTQIYWLLKKIIWLVFHIYMTNIHTTTWSNLGKKIIKMIS